jgi:hypothetical protein
MSKVTLNDVRISYTQSLFTAQQVQGQGEAKFSSGFIFPRNHPSVPALQEAVINAAKAKWPTKWEEILKQLKAADRLPVHDGDAKADSPGYAGNLYMNASNKLRPLVVDDLRQPLTAADGKPYSGSYVNAIVEIWAQDNQYGKRINASLLGVQFVRDGERLAGGSVASADDFQEIPRKDAPATAKEGAAALF